MEVEPLVLAIGLWLASLCPPALQSPGPVARGFHYTGLNGLLLGWFGLFGRARWILPWSANGLDWISLVSRIVRRHPGRQALLMVLAAISLAPVALVNRRIEMVEAGDATDFVPGLGFYP